MAPTATRPRLRPRWHFIPSGPVRPGRVTPEREPRTVVQTRILDSNSHPQPHATRPARPGPSTVIRSTLVSRAILAGASDRYRVSTTSVGVPASLVCGVPGFGPGDAWGPPWPSPPGTSDRSCLPEQCRGIPAHRRVERRVQPTRNGRRCWFVVCADVAINLRRSGAPVGPGDTDRRLPHWGGADWWSRRRTSRRHRETRTAVLGQRSVGELGRTGARRLKGWS